MSTKKKQYSEIYERLLRLCKENNLTPTSLCINITGSQGNLATWKKGNIRADYLLQIADYLNVSADYLLGRTDVPTFEDIAKMNNLNSEGKNMVIEYIRILSNNDKYIRKPLVDLEDGYEIAAFGGEETQGVPEDTEPEITT